MNTTEIATLLMLLMFLGALTYALPTVLDEWLHSRETTRNDHEWARLQRTLTQAHRDLGVGK